MEQSKAPIYEALKRFKSMRVVPFDVPGHKRGKGNPELTSFLGQQCMDVDVNSMKPLDNLCHPVSVIREAEELAAEAFGAKHAFFMVNGTTSAVQAMVFAAVKEGEKIMEKTDVPKPGTPPCAMAVSRSSSFSIRLFVMPATALSVSPF